MRFYGVRVLPAFLGFFWVVLAGGQTGDPVGQTRGLLEEWVEVEKLITAEREDWVESAATLNDLILLLEREQRTLAAQLADAREVSTEADGRRVELVAERDRLQSVAAGLGASIRRHEVRLRTLAEAFPAPLREQINPLLQRIPTDPERSGLSLGQRAQNLVGILGEVDRFNRVVTLDTRVQPLPDGRSAEVRILYLGLGQAYFADVSGRYAGQLVWTGEAWETVLDPALAPRVSRAIAQLERRHQAEFVALPLEVR